MKDYSLGKIYKMISPSGLTYVGSTCEPTLARRKAKHHGCYKCWKRGKANFVTSYKLFDEAEDSVEIVLLETCPCGSSDELYKRERYYIDRLDCVNKVLPTRSAQEYRIDNRDKLLDNNKQYHKICKTSIANRKRLYRLNHIENATMSTLCYCGGTWTRENKYNHFHCSKHQKYIREQMFEAYIKTNPNLDDAVKHIHLFH